MPAKKKRTAFESLTTALWRRRRLLGWSAVVALMGGGIVGAGYGLDLARTSLRIAAQSGPPRMEANPSPDWLSNDVVAPILLGIGKNAASTPSAADVGRALEQCPWVRSAHVRRTRTGFGCQLDFRRPLVAVSWGDRCCYVDRDGVALDVDTMSLKSGAECLTLEGIEARGLPKVGQRVQGDAVRAAGRLAESIGELGFPLRFDRIHVEPGDRIGGPAFVLTTQDGARIFWGKVESTDETKLRRLRTLVASGARPLPGQVIDLR